jgi:hypothetical protein
MTKVWLLLAVLPASCYATRPEYQTFGPFETKERCESAIVDLQRTFIIERNIISGAALAACIEVLR